MATRITIRGQTYSVRSDEEDVDLQQVARYVDSRLAEVAGASRTLDDYTVALLGALNIASDFWRWRHRTDRDLADLERQLASVGVLMDAAMPPESSDRIGESAPTAEEPS